jgi:ribonuclease Z
MKMTITRTLDNYVVHELLTPEDPITPCEPRPSDSSPTDQHTLEPNILHSSELAGFDIRPSPDGFWRAITQAQGVLSPIVVDAGSILHRGKFAFVLSLHPRCSSSFRSLYRLYIY